MKLKYRDTSELYYENIGSFWGKAAVVLFFAVTILLFALYFYELSHGPIGGENATPDWFYIMMFCIFLSVSLLVLNFYSLTISITTDGITAAYGLFRHHVAWDNVAGYELDSGSVFRQYGGYGIRFGWRKNGAVQVYNTTGSSLIALELKNPGSYRYFGFSTKHPDEVMSLIENHKR